MDWSNIDHPMPVICPECGHKFNSDLIVLIVPLATSICPICGRAFKPEDPLLKK